MVRGKENMGDKKKTFQTRRATSLWHASYDQACYLSEPYVRLFRGAVGPEFIFMDDNARAHRALMVDEYLESEDIQRMAWSAYSPDLYPIERAWDAFGRAIAMRQPLPRTTLELKIALVEEWEGLPQIFLVIQFK